MRLRAREASTFHTDVPRFWDALNDKVERYRDNYALREAELPEDRRTAFEMTADVFGERKAFHLKNAYIECWWSCEVSRIGDARLRAVFHEAVCFRLKHFFLLALSGIRPRNELNSLILELHMELDNRIHTGYNRSMF